MEHNIQYQTRIIILESQELFRLGLHTFLASRPELLLVAEFERFEPLLEHFAELAPDIVLFDLLAESGLAFRQIPQLRKLLPNCRVLALASNQEQALLVEALHHGAAGIFGKHQSGELLLKAISSVANGEPWFDRQLSHAVLLAESNRLAAMQSACPPLAALLSKREYGIACLVAKGLSAKKISTRLNISEKTVRNKLTAVYEKLKVEGQIDLCLKAPELGFCREFNQSCSWDICPNYAG
ncbi:hypothetical protein [Methylomonas albis]|uniref:Response regulator transcription factor n=1 Tax=Methylomonas albis TaxID=1854563 RepID=A0ABR9D685_9GAMM|nr:response regulator transcription factor [Methylomonas albis]MBD9357382.1 response regulator transcription factor [Methylomonas albis]CAD6880640.1 hypothetical protein [Methylomonas albis]